MGRVKEIAELVRNQQNLLEIKAATKVTMPTILDYLRRACGYGYISRADIYFAIPRRYRALFYLYENHRTTGVYKHLKTATGSGSSSQELSPKQNQIIQEAEKVIAGTYNTSLAELPWNDWDQDLYKAYLEFSNADYLRADLYWDIANLEITFNRFIRAVLVKHFGEGEENWWRQGIKKELRAELAERREMDDEPAADALCYLTFINIKEILDKNWAIFSEYFSPEIKNNKKTFLNNLGKINSIRNQVMHPIKNARFTYVDFELIHTCLSEVERAYKTV